jgi:hypothetical protein
MKAILILLLFITINSYSQRLYVVYQDCAMIVITTDSTISRKLIKHDKLQEYSPGWSTNYSDNVNMYWFAIENKETILKQLDEL